MITQFNNFDKELTNHKGRVMTWDWQYTNRLNGIETFAYTAKNINDNPLTFSYLDLVKKKYETDLEDSEISLDDLVKAFKILYDYPENYTDA